MRENLQGSAFLVCKHLARTQTVKSLKNMTSMSFSADSLEDSCRVVLTMLLSAADQDEDKTVQEVLKVTWVGSWLNKGDFLRFS